MSSRVPFFYIASFLLFCIAGCSSTADIPPSQAAKKENHRQEEAHEGELWQSPRFILRMQEEEEERLESQ
ncbi:hypothetical protein [Hydrogenimonas cancrithermarum]|uniref:Secreted protein n=1 Tax=Hydrogenimonas cancrithermarum TaxID=2993563 RepID=A0ABN6WU63_9BACT|nr:hypothetical protein [Hydrogenimonas cancrithermarum]BDY12299.1 hypothetical protein HCR_06110 [Hydrogenimonas cancrithermarum]